MSLINQMLKDLDNRHGPSGGAQLAALQGMGLASVNQVQWQNTVPFLVWLLGGILALFVFFRFLPGWLDKVEPELPQATAQQQVGQDDLSALHAAPAVRKTGAATDTAAHQASSAADISRQIPEPRRSGQTEVEQSMAAAAPEKVTEPQGTVQEDPEASDTTRQKGKSPPSGPVSLKEPSQVKAINSRIEKLTPAQRISRFLADAQAARNAQQLQRAALLLREILDEEPSHTAARVRLADILVEQGRVIEGEQLLAEGLLTAPDKVELARPYARLLAARDALSPALEILDGAVDRNHPDSESLALRAAILYRMNRHSESVTAYREALREQPARALWWTGLAVALEHDHQPVQALQAYRRSAKLPLEPAVSAYVTQRIQALDKSEALY